MSNACAHEFQDIVKSWEKNTNNKEIFETLLKHHIKGAFADNIIAIMEERGLIEDIDDDVAQFLFETVDLDRYEEDYRYPTYEAAKCPSKMNMRVKVKFLFFIIVSYVFHVLKKVKLKLFFIIVSYVFHVFNA